MVSKSGDLPNYCKVLKITDANGNVKEMVFPKALDLERPKRARTSFSAQQLYRLEVEFARNQYLVGRERKELAKELGLSETQVKVWFQNRRTKRKRDSDKPDESVNEEKVSANTVNKTTAEITESERVRLKRPANSQNDELPLLKAPYLFDTIPAASSLWSAAVTASSVTSSTTTAMPHSPTAVTAPHLPQPPMANTTTSSLLNTHPFFTSAQHTQPQSNLTPTALGTIGHNQLLDAFARFVPPTPGAPPAVPPQLPPSLSNVPFGACAPPHALLLPYGTCFR